MPTCRLRAVAAGALSLFCASASIAADFTARQVTQAFYESSGPPPDFSGADLSFLDLSNIDFKGAKLSNVNLFGADLTRSNLRGANLGANLQGASMMRPSINIALDRNRSEAPKFAGANLKGIRLTAMMDGADFRGADLTGAKLGPHEPRADISSMPASLLRGSDFSGAILRDADLMWAKLAFSKFVGADLSGAVLIGADLSKADLSGADLAGADLTDADFDGAKLAGVRGLESAKGMATVKNWDRVHR